MFLCVVQEVRNGLGGVRVGQRHTIRYGLEPKGGLVLDSVQAFGSDQPTMVELSVDKGDKEATGMKKLS